MVTDGFSLKDLFDPNFIWELSRDLLKAGRERKLEKGSHLERVGVITIEKAQNLKQVVDEWFTSTPDVSELNQKQNGIEKDLEKLEMRYKSFVETSNIVEKENEELKIKAEMAASQISQLRFELAQKDKKILEMEGLLKSYLNDKDKDLLQLKSLQGQLEESKELVAALKLPKLQVSVEDKENTGFIQDDSSVDKKSRSPKKNVFQKIMPRSTRKASSKAKKSNSVTTAGTQ